ncbi:MAG: cytochrome P450 [Streptosporangiales bacterium]|nr:cytochrome P450 [Streptosporangiales bacterium]
MAGDISQERPYDEIDLTTRAFWALSAAEREERFAVLRERRPISWQRPVRRPMFPHLPDPGYWAVVCYDDIVEVSRTPEVFGSGEGVQLQTVPPEFNEESQSFIAMDHPRHTKLRKLVSSAFTPRQVQRLEDRINANAATIVEDLAVLGSGTDFVAHCSGRLPAQTIADMIGIPEQERDQVVHHANATAQSGDPAFRAGRDPFEIILEAQTYFQNTAIAMAEQRRREPADDLMTRLAQAEVDGDRLTDLEIGAFFVLLSIAGNDTTRQTTSHTLKALTDFPEQRAWLMEDFEGRIGRAVEEFIRWASPVMTFRRTALADTELHGQKIAAGEKVVMFYPSGNRDPKVFADPGRFDLARDPNPHVGFGGGGPHFCLGAQVAKTQLRAIFRELLHRLPDIRAGEPDYLTGSAIFHGVKSMPCTFTAAGS